MVIDTSLAWRKVWAFAPRWVRYALLFSIMVGECFRTLTKIFAPVLSSNLSNLMEFKNISEFEWPFVGMAITMPVALAWHVAARHIRGPTPFEKAEDYIAIVKLFLASASYTPTQTRVFWHAALEKVTRDFSVGTEPPNAASVASRADQDVQSAAPTAD